MIASKPIRILLAGVLAILSSGFARGESAPARLTFEVATVKPVEPDAKAGRYILMEGNNRFVAKNYNLKLLIAAAYDVSAKVISGGPGWVESERFDIVALTPGQTKPRRQDQMAMLRSLLEDRFKLTFHREERAFAIYELVVAKGGPKLKHSEAVANEAGTLIGTVYPDHIHLPARNASMAEFVSMLQRALLDRPVVDKTGINGKFDFDLDWAPDETQFGGEVPVAPTDASSPPFFVAIEQQLGLHIDAKRGPVSALIVDSAQRPSAD
jgi:Protein of unknown function (DUF3738).